MDPDEAKDARQRFNATIGEAVNTIHQLEWLVSRVEELENDLAYYQAENVTLENYATGLECDLAALQEQLDDV